MLALADVKEIDMKAKTTKRIEKKMGDEFMTVILSFDKIKSSLNDVTQMMLQKKFTDEDIKKYITDLVAEAVDVNLKETELVKKFRKSCQNA